MNALNMNIAFQSYIPNTNSDNRILVKISLETPLVVPLYWMLSVKISLFLIARWSGLRRFSRREKLALRFKLIRPKYWTLIIQLVTAVKGSDVLTLLLYDFSLLLILLALHPGKSWMELSKCQMHVSPCPDTPAPTTGKWRPQPVHFSMSS